MRNLIIGCIAMALIAACGGGSREAAMAKTAHYKGDKLEIFSALKTAVEEKYPLQQADETTLVVQTQPRWFTPEGLGTTSGAQDIRNIPDKSINVSFVVKQVPDGDSFLVVVEGKLLRFQKGSPQPEPRDLKSADLPAWVYSKADQLVLDIHRALGKWEVKAGAAAPGAPAPAPTPAPAPGPEGTGSAAPDPAPAPAP